MFSSIWTTLYGLLVDDGQLAAGAVLALALTWALASAGGSVTQPLSGWALLAMVLVLVVANLYRAGLSARRRVSSARR